MPKHLGCCCGPLPWNCANCAGCASAYAVALNGWELERVLPGHATWPVYWMELEDCVSSMTGGGSGPSPCNYQVPSGPYSGTWHWQVEPNPVQHFAYGDLTEVVEQVCSSVPGVPELDQVPWIQLATHVPLSGTFHRWLIWIKTASTGPCSPDGTWGLWGSHDNAGSYAPIGAAWPGYPSDYRWNLLTAGTLTVT